MSLPTRGHFAARVKNETALLGAQKKALGSSYFVLQGFLGSTFQFCEFALSVVSTGDVV